MMTMVEALNKALLDAMSENDRVLVMGEDVGVLGGVFRVTAGLQAKFGAERCFDTPLAESGIVGTAIGLALYGYRPVVEMQFDGFTYPAFEQIVSHLAKFRSRSRGQLGLPITIRIPYGGGIGAAELHSESPEGMFANVPGLRLIAPATPTDAYALLSGAIRCDDPVVIFEPKQEYWTREEIDFGQTVPALDSAVVRRHGRTASVFAYGSMLRPCLAAAAAAVQHGWDLEVVDLRSLSPLDVRTITDSVDKTGRAIVVHEAPGFGGLGGEIAALITQECFYSLKAPPLRVTGFDIPYPPATLEKHHRPSAERILDAVERSVRFE